MSANFLILCEFWRTQYINDLVKGQKTRFSVIPTKAGIQFFQRLINTLDSGFYRSDDFL